MANPRKKFDDLEFKRFTPSNLNHLIAALKPDDVKEQSVKIATTDHSQMQDFPYFAVEFKAEKFIVFNVSKDSKSFNNETVLPYIGEVLNNFLKDHKEEKDSTLLLPMRQCRGYGKARFFNHQLLKKEHIVLVEVNLAKQKITVQDSQGDFMRQSLYPDVLKDISASLKMAYVYRGHNVQKDKFSCGYFVHQYIRARLKAGKEADLSKIKLATVDSEHFKLSYIAKYMWPNDYLVFMKCEEEESRQEMFEQFKKRYEAIDVGFNLPDPDAYDLPDEEDDFSLS